MDSREIHQQHQHQLQQQSPPGMVMGHNNSFHQNPNSAALMGSTSTSQSIQHRLLPFGAILPHHHHHPQLQQQMVNQKTLESLGFEGSHSSLATQQSIRFGIEQQQQQQLQAKKKRGRPRKYAPEGNIALGLAPTHSGSNSYGGGDGGGGAGESGGANANSSDPPAKRNRGRPPGSGKKQLDALGGTVGVGFTPHVIEVKTGEDIAVKVMEFTRQGPRAICILSATGAVSNMMLHQATNSSGVAEYEGSWEIISLSGSYLNTESNGTVTKSGNLCVSLAGPDGRIFGGSVAGMLVAGSQVQVIVGSFVPDGKKQKQSAVRTQNNPEPASAPANMLSFRGGGHGPGSPRSQGQQQQHSSDSSEEKESTSPLHHGNNNHGLFGNSTPQPMHQMSMPYHHLWPNSNP